MLSKESVCPILWWATGKDQPAGFLETVALCEGICGNLKRKLSSSFYHHTISVHAFFCVCICLIFYFAYLAFCCFCAMLFSVSHLSIVSIFCFLYFMPGVYLKSPMWCLRCVYCFTFSKIRSLSSVSDLRFLCLNDSLWFGYGSLNVVSQIP